MKNNKIWILYDKRQTHIYEIYETLKHAKNNRKNYGDDTIIIKATVNLGTIIDKKIVNL